MKTVPEYEVDLENTVNQTIRSGQLGVIVNDAQRYEVVYFTHCHYLGSSGGISNTFSYRSFSKSGVLRNKVKSYMYKPIYPLKNNKNYRTEIVLITGENDAD